MKKFGFFAVALAAAAISFTSCKDNGQNNGGGVDLNALPNGFYVSEQGADLIEVNAIEQGINEVDQTARQGMYEKYIVLEAGKKYEFVNKKGENADHFGVENLQYGDSIINTDNKQIAGYQGSLAANTVVEVKETNLYHIVLDFNEDGNLTDVGGAQCIIVPVEWGVRGAMNSWGFTAAVKNGNAYELKGLECGTKGEFKWAHNNCWKINLDIANLVKANTNLGNDAATDGEEFAGLKAGGKNFPIERAIYDLTLEYVGPASTIAESFKMTMTKTGDLATLDPSKFVYSFIGSITDANWGIDTDLAFVSNNGDHYVFEAKGLDFAAGEFKIRRDHDWGVSFGAKSMTITGIDFTGEDNIVIAAPFKGSAKFEYDWDGSAEKNVTLTFTAE